MIKLEMMRGRMSIFSILMSISPGKAINMTTSGWIGDAKRRSPPLTAPRMTPMRKGGNLDLVLFLTPVKEELVSVTFPFLILLYYQMMNSMEQKYHEISEADVDE